jgi:hypothetical protein
MPVLFFFIAHSLQARPNSDSIPKLRNKAFTSTDVPQDPTIPRQQIARKRPVIRFNETTQKSELAETTPGPKRIKQQKFDGELAEEKTVRKQQTFSEDFTEEISSNRQRRSSEIPLEDSSKRKSRSSAQQGNSQVESLKEKKSGVSSNDGVGELLLKGKKLEDRISGRRRAGSNQDVGDEIPVKKKKLVDGSSAKKSVVSNQDVGDEIPVKKKKLVDKTSATKRVVSDQDVGDEVPVKQKELDVLPDDQEETIQEREDQRSILKSTPIPRTATPAPTTLNPQILIESGKRQIIARRSIRKPRLDEDFDDSARVKRAVLVDEETFQQQDWLPRSNLLGVGIVVTITAGVAIVIAFFGNGGTGLKTLFVEDGRPLLDGEEP